MTTQDRLRAFMLDELQCDVAPERLTNNLPLIDERVIDSMGIYEIVTFIEGSFGVEVQDEDLLPENFETIDAIARLIGQKKSDT